MSRWAPAGKDNNWVPKLIANPEPRAYFVGFGDSALGFKLRAWSELLDDG